MARIGGAFPFPLPQIGEGTSKVAVPPAGFWYPPSGQYIIVTDANTRMQWWDAQNQQWQTLLGASQGALVTVDGINYRLSNVTGGTLTTATVTPGGSGLLNGIGALQNGVQVAVTGGTQAANNPAPSWYAITGGVAAAPTVTRAGSGFLIPPILVADPPPAGGQQAYADCVLTASGGIGAITLRSGGAGYIQGSPPNWWIIPQPNYYAGGPSGGIVAASYPAPGLIDPLNALSAQQPNIDSVNGAKLTPNANTGSGTITAIVQVGFSSGWSSTAPTAALSLTGGFPGSVSGASFTVTVGAAAALGIVTVAARVNE